MRLARVRYLLKWNSFSSSVNCFVVKLVRPVLLAELPPLWLLAVELFEVRLVSELAELGDTLP